MNANRFDQIVKGVCAAGTRRGMLHLLAALPFIGALTARISEEEAAAKRKRNARRRVGTENHKHPGRRRKHKNHQEKHRKHKKKKCKGGCACGDVCESGCQFPSVQAAIDAANDGDTITICAGTYAPITVTKNLTLIGAGDGDDPANNTNLDAQQSGGVVSINPGLTVTLEGLRLTGGVSDAGGVRNAGDLTMTGCTVIGNAGSGGGPGGILSLGPLTMTDCTVSENSTSGDNSGGIRTFNADLTLTRCTISGNTGSTGGIYVQGTGILTETTITDNTGTTSSEAGGLYTDGGTTTLVDSTVSGNTPPNCRAAVTGAINGPGCAP